MGDIQKQNEYDIAVSGFASLTLAATKPKPRATGARHKASSAYRAPRPTAIRPSFDVNSTHALPKRSASQEDAPKASSIPSLSQAVSAGASIEKNSGSSGSVTDVQRVTLQSTSRMFPSLLPARNPTGGLRGPSAAAARKPAIVWFRTDLRLHDHEPLALANKLGTSVLPVYCFDPREYGKNASGFDRSGPYRARFILDSVAELRARLREAGSELVVRMGRPEELLPRLAAEVGAGAVYCHSEVAYEELQVERAVREGLQREGTELKALWGNSLYHPDDLPFSLQQLPGNYAEFKEKLARSAVRGPMEMPQQLKGVPAGGVEGGDMPSMLDLGFSADMLERCERDRSVVAGLKGGELQALQQLRAFISEVSSRLTPVSSSSLPPSAPPSHSNPSTSFACRISPWLAVGCLSPRQMFDEVSSHFRKLTQAVPASTGRPAMWLMYELMWRDFFKMITRKYSLAAVGPGQAAAAAPAGAGAEAQRRSQTMLAAA